MTIDALNECAVPNVSADGTDLTTICDSMLMWFMVDAILRLSAMNIMNQT